MVADVFSSYSRYYDLLYRDKDYLGEVAYIRGILKRNGVEKGDLLEFGSGTGKHGRLLVKQGYSVHGIERSPEMVAKAETGLGFTCQRGDIADTVLERKFAAVLSLFHVIGYQTNTRQLRAVFANAAAHLYAGGLFIFDFWYSPAVYNLRPTVRIKRMKNEEIEVTRIAEPILFPNDNRVDVNYTIYVRDLVDGSIQSMRESHSMRHFSLPEIQLLADEHGFDLIMAEEFLSGNVPSENTWGVCVTLRKINND